jgi:PAS domain S-box-containing protein
MPLTERENPDVDEAARLKARLLELEERNASLLRYIRAKSDHLLSVMQCSAGNTDSLDDDMLISLDPIGTITDSFTQVVDNLHGMNERLWGEIAERSRVESALRENEERLQDFFDSALDLIQIVDADGRFVSVNRAWLETMGYAHDEAVNMSIFDVLAPESLEHCRTCFGRVMSNADIGRVEFEMISKDGRRITLEGYVNPRLEGGRVVAARSIFRDITERRKLERNLLNAEKLESIGVLAGGIAHDFNNLLTAILGNISLAIEHTPGAGPARYNLAEAEDASLRARDLTQQLLTFSKGGSPIRRMVSIAGIVRDSATFALRGSNVRCDFEIADDLAPVAVDAGQFGQVVHNLVGNARQAMPDGGVVRVRCENAILEPGHNLPMGDGPCIRITVEDQGVGIPSENLKRIFDPFFSTRKDGSGLGLAVCYSVVRQHDGALTVESEPGKGSRFVIHLPASEDRQGVPPDPKRTAGTSHSTHTRRILIMDDEEMVRKVATEVLTAIGYDAEGVPDGAAAIERYSAAMREARPFDAVLMDLTIPGGMGGKEAVRKVLDIDPGAKVIVSSGYSNDPVMADHRAFGFCGVIAKPYRIKDLRELLGRLVPVGPSATPGSA